MAVTAAPNSGVTGQHVQFRSQTAKWPCRRARVARLCRWRSSRPARPARATARQDSRGHRAPAGAQGPSGLRRRPDRSRPNSAPVVERPRTHERPGIRTVFLLGNHEEVLLRILAGEPDLIEKWRSFGGSECLKSYGVDPAALSGLDDEDALAVVTRAIPRKHVEFLESFDDSCRFGDYLIVHAGIRPGVEFDQQRQADLRWIRDPFLFDETDHGFVVVHGHTIRPEVEMRPNRIGIDTGAYRSGILTALAIEGSDSWLLDTRTAAHEAVSY